MTTPLFNHIPLMRQQACIPVDPHMHPCDRKIYFAPLWHRTNCYTMSTLLNKNCDTNCFSISQFFLSPIPTHRIRVWPLQALMATAVSPAPGRTFPRIMHAAMVVCTYKDRPLYYQLWIIRKVRTKYMRVSVLEEGLGNKWHWKGVGAAAGHLVWLIIDAVTRPLS